VSKNFGRAEPKSISRLADPINEAPRRSDGWKLASQIMIFDIRHGRWKACWEATLFRSEWPRFRLEQLSGGKELSRFWNELYS